MPEPAPIAEESGDAVEFVRFCYRRRAVAWPELYDVMSAVAARREFNGWGYGELAERGIDLTLPHLPRLAALAAHVAGEERGRGTSRRVG